MKTISRCAALVTCAALIACGDSGVGSGPPKNVSGNWYFVNPPGPVAQPAFSQVGAALRSVNGQITGNANVALTGPGSVCASFALNLPVTGTVDAQGHLALLAAYSADTFSASGTVAAEKMSGTFHAEGYEILPDRASVQGACTTLGGAFNGVLIEPVNATYTGTLNDSSGHIVSVQLTTHQDTLPIASAPSNAANPQAIPVGVPPFFQVGGFAVTGTMQLSSPLCGVTTGTIHANYGYVWGTLLQVEFAPDTTHQHGAWFQAYIDPTSGSLNFVQGYVYDDTQSPICVISPLVGTLTRQ